MKKIILITLLSVSYSCFSQTLSSYKYVLVPSTFSFQKTPHQYNLNRLTQFLLNKYNFESFLEGESDAVLKTVDASKLLRLNATAKGILSTKIIVSFIDFKGNTVYTSQEGKSNRKDFKKSYTEALRNVFKDKELFNHKYIKEIKKPDNLKVEKKVKTQTANFLGIEVFQLQFELRGKIYNFVPFSKNEYTVLEGSKKIGKAKQLKGTTSFIVEAGSLSGKGEFDDFGNFIITRINPVNKKELIDTLVRVK